MSTQPAYAGRYGPWSSRPRRASRTARAAPSGIDDFGTGYSSLHYILQLPIDVLKIDKRFIDSVDGDDKESRLAAAIIGLSRVLDLSCIAEGVERPAQQERLKELGCEYAQGFLFARPMSSDALRELLSATGAAPPAVEEWTIPAAALSTAAGRGPV